MNETLLPQEPQDQLTSTADSAECCIYYRTVAEDECQGAKQCVLSDQQGLKGLLSKKTQCFQLNVKENYTQKKNQRVAGMIQRDSLH